MTKTTAALHEHSFFLLFLLLLPLPLPPPERCGPASCSSFAHQQSVMLGACSRGLCVWAQMLSGLLQEEKFFSSRILLLLLLLHHLLCHDGGLQLFAHVAGDQEESLPCSSSCSAQQLIFCCYCCW